MDGHIRLVRNGPRHRQSIGAVLVFADAALVSH
jgi:hypothetical protein